MKKIDACAKAYKLGRSMITFLKPLNMGDIDDAFQKGADVMRQFSEEWMKKRLADGEVTEYLKELVADYRNYLDSMDD